MFEVGDLVATRTACEPEEEILYLPSDLSSSERLAMGLVQLGVEEGKLREGEAYDALQSVRSASKWISATHQYRNKNIKGQQAHTRANEQSEVIENKRDDGIDRYMGARKAMLSLGTVSDTTKTRSSRHSFSWIPFGSPRTTSASSVTRADSMVPFTTWWQLRTLHCQVNQSSRRLLPRWRQDISFESS